MLESNKYDFGRFPFVFTPLTKPTNDPLPDFLPFQLEIDNENGLIIQSYNQEVSHALHEAYLASSQITGMMDNHGIGKEYANDFLNYIKKQTGRNNFAGCRILDIGCGTGYLLYLLKNLGAEVVGIEPGSHGQVGAELYSIPIIQDFFPSSQVMGEFDFIISFGLLEHIEKFDLFFNPALHCLKTNGVMIFAVPDCQPYLDSGDISFLFHEHWNYFTQKDLCTTISNYTGLQTETHRSGFGGTIYSTTLNEKATPRLTVNIDTRKKQLYKFSKISRSISERLKKIFNKATSNNESIGIFVPCRIVNILASFNKQINLQDVRFFDDNTKLHGTYYPGFDIIVESRDDLLRNPTDKLLIMSHSFGDKIDHELKLQHLNSEVITWKDLFAL